MAMTAQTITSETPTTAPSPLRVELRRPSFGSSRCYQDDNEDKREDAKDPDPIAKDERVERIERVKGRR
jgi:hypothetical protein